MFQMHPRRTSSFRGVTAEFPSSLCFDLDATQSNSYTEHTLDAAAAVDKGGGEVGIPITSHNFIAGQAITIAGTTNYNADEVIVSQTANEIVITATFVSETFGGTETAKSQEWLNRTVSPNDGSAQTDYDFFLGADAVSSTDDPFFTGTVGDNAAYFAMDGGDFFTAKNITAPAVFNGAHKTSGTDSGPKWIAFTLKLVEAGTSQMLWGNSGGGKDGVRFRHIAVDNTRFVQVKDPSGAVTVNVQDSGVVNAETIFILTWDSSNAGSEQFWYRSTTGENWTDTYVPDTNTADADLAFQIGTVVGISIVRNGTRVYACSGGNSILTDAEAAGIFALYESVLRHNRDYTP